MGAIIINKKQWLIKALLVTGLGFISISCFAQVDPTDTIPGDPGAITVYTVQNMSFGAFSNGSTGGTVIILTNGTRSVTGNVVPLNLGTSYYQAIFDIDAPIGSIVSILNGSDATLTGSNGGSMSMHIGGSDPPSPFITIVSQPARTQVSIGGTLTVGSTAANPPGTYNGTFYITFNLE
jgi:Domain of unknown function (DUF4402)